MHLSAEGIISIQWSYLSCEYLLAARAQAQRDLDRSDILLKSFHLFFACRHFLFSVINTKQRKKS